MLKKLWKKRHLLRPNPTMELCNPALCPPLCLNLRCSMKSDPAAAGTCGH